MQSDSSHRRTRSVFYGWWVVTAGTFLYFVGIGSVFYGFSAFFNPMVAEFSWSRAVTSGAYVLSHLEGGIEGPIVGLGGGLQRSFSVWKAAGVRLHIVCRGWTDCVAGVKSVAPRREPVEELAPQATAEEPTARTKGFMAPGQLQRSEGYVAGGGKAHCSQEGLPTHPPRGAAGLAR